MQLKYTLFSSISMLAFSSLSVFSQTEKMNVLFLMADDMRPELGCYGVKEVKTPNIDRFAASGLLFQNAYCNIPVSGASRASLLTGVYPHYPDRFVNYSAYASKDCPTAIPISRWFTSHGYYTISNGKVFHHLSDHANSWSEPPYRKHPDGYDVYWAEYNKWELWMNEASARTINPKTMRGPFCEWAEVPDTAYDDGKLALKAIADLKRLKEQGKPFFMACGFWKPHLPFNAPKKYWDLYDREKIPVANNPKTMRGPFCEWAEVPDTAYDDGKLALKAIADLKRLKEQGKPFFMACGFWKPHLPFNAPKKYWDLYDREKIPVANNRFRPKDLPNEVKNSTEIYAYARTTTADDISFQKEAKHGYYACLSYVDAQIGKVLDALDELGLANNTIVVLLGDHGWHLGEHNFLGKHNLMDRSTHVPLIVRVPGLKKGKTKSMVEFVDLYPTLCELCHLPIPKNQLDGTSFVPILTNLKAKIKDQVYIQWEGGDNAVSNRYNYAEWKQKEKIHSRMLFDHHIDPEENKNRVNERKYRSEINKLSSFLKAKKETLMKSQ